MGGSPITESSPMVSSPLHLTPSLPEMLVKSTTTDTASDVDKNENNNDSMLFDASSSSDTSGSDSDCSITFCSTPRRKAIRNDAAPGSSKSVAFGDIQQRSYTVVMGDHPCCSMGCPLSLGWEYSQDASVSIDRYEATRSPRRTRENLRTTCAERRNILSDVGVSDGDVKRAERKLHRERSCSRKMNRRTCAAFFQGPPGDARSIAAHA